MKEPDSKCYRHAVRYLTRYPKTEQELKIYLLEKGYLQHEIDLAMEYLKFKKYIDDEQFVELYFNSEVVRKWRPIYVAKNKLRQKWVDERLVSAYISEHENEIESGIHQKIRKEINQYKARGVDGFDIIQKIMRKGYKLDDIKTVIQKNAEKSNGDC